MSLILTSISSTPWLEMISNEGIARSRTSISTMRWSSLPSRSCARSFSRVRCVCSRCWASSVSLVPCAGGGVGQQEVEDALFGGLLGAICDFVELFLAHHVDRGFHQVAHHGLDVAADVADLGVFGGL